MRELMNKLKINGVEFDIDDDNITISQVKRSIYVNGKLVTTTNDESVHIEFTGNVTNLNCNTCDITGDVLTVNANSAKIGGNVGGCIDANSVEVKGNVQGDIDANSVKVQGGHTGSINV